MCILVLVILTAISIFYSALPTIFELMPKSQCMTRYLYLAHQKIHDILCTRNVSCTSDHLQCVVSAIYVPGTIICDSVPSHSAIMCLCQLRAGMEFSVTC